MLYPVEPRARITKWGGWRDLNPRPPDPQSGALPAELQPPQRKKFKFGAPGRIRTCNPRIRSPMLYPLSHGRWSGRRDSNPQPSAWKANALPIELQPLAWSGRLDLNQRPPVPKTGALPSALLPVAGINISDFVLNVNIPSMPKR